MKAATFFLTLALLAVPAYPQKRELPDMPQRRLTWQEGELFADSFLSEGATIRIIKNEGLTVATVCYDYRDYLACEVSVVNNTPKRIDVIPENYFMAGTYQNGKADYVYSLPPTKLAKKYESRGK